VALGATDGGTHPDSHRCVYAVDDGNVAKFLVLSATFVVGHGVAVEGGGNQLIFAGSGQQVAGNLFDRELIEPHAAVEGPDDPVTIWPHGAGRVVSITGGVCVAGQVQPLAGPVLAVFRSLQQVLNQLLPCRFADTLMTAGRRQLSQPF